MVQDESTDGGAGACDSGVFTNGLSQSDIEVLNRLKEAFDRQTSQVHNQEKELADRLKDIESVSSLVLISALFSHSCDSLEMREAVLGLEVIRSETAFVTDDL